MENKCEIVQDLLPTYIENLTSEKTTAFIKEHLDSCENCRKIYENMKSELEDKDVEDTEIVNEIKKYKTRLTIIKSVFLLIILGIIGLVIVTISYKFYVLKNVYIRNTNYKAFESFSVDEYEGSIEAHDKHYTTYYKNDTMKKFYGDELKEYYDGENHYFFDDENKTYWVKKEKVNTSLNINISIIDGMENIVKDNGKISNFEILKFIILNKDLSVNTRTFRQKYYYQIYCDGDLMFFDADTFFAERIKEQKIKYEWEETTEYRVTTANVGWGNEISEPDFSKYTLIEKE